MILVSTMNSCQSTFCKKVNCPCVSPHYARRRILRVKLMSLYLNFEITKLLSRHLTSSKSDQETAAIRIKRQQQREGCPSTEVVFQGVPSSALFIFRKCRMASRTFLCRKASTSKALTRVIEFLVRLFHTL